MFEKKAHRTLDMKHEIMKAESLPYGRRDHTFNIIPQWSIGMLIGGWNSLEWCPDHRLLNVWSLTPEWHWDRIDVSDNDDFQPLQRRGHTAVFHEKTNQLIVFGGVFGYSRYLNEVLIFQFNAKLMKMVCFRQEFLEEEGAVIPEPRAWHSASIINGIMYVYGGLKRHNIHTNELLSYEI